MHVNIIIGVLFIIVGTIIFIVGTKQENKV